MIQRTLPHGAKTIPISTFLSPRRQALAANLIREDVRQRQLSRIDVTGRRDGHLILRRPR